MSQPSTTPSLRGKTVAVYTRSRPTGPAVLSECMLETRGDRLFLVGTSIRTQRSAPEWTDGVRRAIAWDVVDEYFLFDSPEAYYAREPVTAAAEPEPEPQMPLVAFPESSEGRPVDESGVYFEPETPLELGAIVLAFSQGRWWRAEVIGFEGEDSVRLHFPGWDSTWDVTVAKTELQVDFSESFGSGD